MSSCASLTCAKFPVRAEAPPRRDDRIDRTHPPRFLLRIAPRRFDLGPVPAGAFEVTRGDEPASAGRPFLACLAILVVAIGVYVQVDRWQDCRSEGGAPMTCLLAH